MIVPVVLIRHMNNGTALMAFTEELNRYLENYRSLDYYQQPIPSEIDQRMDEAVKLFISADPAERETFQSSLTPSVRSQFAIYGHRVATRANREKRPDLLELGLVAAVIANYIVPANRRIEISLAIYHYTAVKLGRDPRDLFTYAADYAAADLAASLVAFGSRGDVTLKKYGWKEIDSPDGMLYKFDWR